MKKIGLRFIAVFAVLVFAVATCVFAQDAITVDSVSFFEYVDEYGMTDESLVGVKVSFTSVFSNEITVLLTSENITEISAATKDKIIYMNQITTPEDGVYEFTVEKSRIASATGLEDIDGCPMFIKLGGTNLSQMATKSITFTDPYVSDIVPGDVDGDGEVTNLDGTYLLRYLAGWELEDIHTEAMDVDGDGEVTNLDGTYLLRYLAGWDIILK